jgi:dinuclear metal center YbgI/SA1388 family protein
MESIFSMTTRNSDAATHTDLQKFLDALGEIAPLDLAEDWDNVGLLMGDRNDVVSRVMTCLTISRLTVEEAMEDRADLVITHHPCPFKPIGKLTTETPVGRWLWNLARSGISIYSPHTAWDNARFGINSQLAELIGLKQISPMKPTKLTGEVFAGLGSGRIGFFEAKTALMEIAARLRAAIPEVAIACNDAMEKMCSRVAIVCGSGGSFVRTAAECRADVLLTGEATYHQFLEAEAYGVSLLTIGHFASERFAMNKLAGMLRATFPTTHIWASRRESDSLHFDEIQTKGDESCRK